MDEYVLKGKLLTEEEARIWLENSLHKSIGEIHVISAYLKKSFFDKFLINFNLSKVKFLVRWGLNDLLSGASDLDCYKIIKENNWSLSVNSNLHAKLYSIPPIGIMCGSSNATTRGLNLTNNLSNNEASTIVEINEHNKNFINNLFSSSKEIDDALYQKLLDVIQNSKQDFQKSNFSWPEEIKNILDIPINKDTKLFVSECFLSSGEKIIITKKDLGIPEENDLSLLGISHDLMIANDLISYRFLETKIFRWLKYILKEHGGELRNGAVRSLIHDALAEDPKPYRSEVSAITNNIFSWIKLLGSEKTGIKWSLPGSRSEVLSLVD